MTPADVERIRRAVREELRAEMRESWERAIIELRSAMHDTVRGELVTTVLRGLIREELKSATPPPKRPCARPTPPDGEVFTEQERKEAQAALLRVGKIRKPVVDGRKRSGS